MPYVIITFRRVIFSDAPTSGFKPELIIRSLLHAFVVIFNTFLKSFDAEGLDKMLNSALVQIQAKNENGKLLRLDFFCFAPSKIWAGPSEKGAYGFSNIMQANDIDDVIYDVTIRNIQHATQTFL